MFLECVKPGKSEVVMSAAEGVMGVLVLEEVITETAAVVMSGAVVKALVVRAQETHAGDSVGDRGGGDRGGDGGRVGEGGGRKRW